MRKIFFFTAAISLSSPLLALQIYECKDEENIPYFTETSCGPDAVIHEIHSTPTPTTDTADTSSKQPRYVQEYEESKKRSKLRSIDLKIKGLLSDIESLTKKRDGEIAVYQKKILRNEEKAGKNKKKAELRNKGHKEAIVSIEQKYNEKIAKRQTKISVLLEEKDSIE